jgi:fatty-acyl-CoA synthase
MQFNLGEVNEAIAAAIPDRECIVFRDRRLSYAEVAERSRRLANFLLSRGLGRVEPRSRLAGFESGQDHLALYLYNGNEYLEGMLGAYKARVAPFNVNYRYVEEELRYLLRDSRAKAIVYHAAIAPTLAKVRPELPELELLVQVEDGSGQPLLPGAVEYEVALARSSPKRPDLELSPDDLYIVYTGGTTGMPKGVLWRQNDIFFAAMGATVPGQPSPDSLDQVVARCKGGGLRALPAPPFMHAAAHWVAFNALHNGNTVVIQDVPDRLDARDLLRTTAREKVNVLLIVGDAFARPLVDELERGGHDLAGLRAVASGGAPLNAALKTRLLELLPGAMVIDAVGSSETGAQATHVSTRAAGASTGTFAPGAGACVLSESLDRVLPPGHEGLGWFAQTGYVPLGYLGDRAKTERTFPVVGGVRYSIPGDRARLRHDGVLELLGRDSVTINSGGEKIFAEEVEHALKQHPAVYDAVVCGRPSDRWGQEVVAIVRLRNGMRASEAELLEECARHIARYKLPKAFVFKDEIVRSPSGKADYRWAKEQAAGE